MKKKLKQSHAPEAVIVVILKSYILQSHFIEVRINYHRYVDYLPLFHCDHCLITKNFIILLFVSFFARKFINGRIHVVWHYNFLHADSVLGQAKLIIRFPFQGFQNSMQAGGHFSLFIITKIKQCKKPH